MGPLESTIRLHQLRKQRDPLATVKEAARLLDAIPLIDKQAAAARGERFYVEWHRGKAVVRCRRGGAQGVGAGKRASTSVQRRTSWEARLAVAKAKAKARNRVCMCRRCIADRKVATAALTYLGSS